jgi:hypothetical protein
MSPRRKPEVHQASVSLSGEGGFAARTIKVKAVFDKHGNVRRNWRELEYTQFALQSLYPAGTPRGVLRKKLLNEVNNWLAKNPEYSAARFGPISKNTLSRALDLPLWP